MFGLYDERYEKDGCGVALIANLRGNEDHDTVRDALEALRRLAHRGALGVEEETGDGAGMMTAIPHSFFQAEIQKLFTPKQEIVRGRYGVGLAFLPHNEADRIRIKEGFANLVEALDQSFLGWREVPVGDVTIGKSAKDGQYLLTVYFFSRPIMCIVTPPRRPTRTGTGVYPSGRSRNRGKLRTQTVSYSQTSSQADLQEW